MNEDWRKHILGIRGSLAFRIFLISMVLIVIPLLFLGLFLYQEDARIRSNNNIFILKALMKSKIEELNTIVEHESEFLLGMEYVLQRTENPQGWLEEVSKRGNVSALFHLRKTPEGAYICDMASKAEYLGEEFSALIEIARQQEALLVVRTKDRRFFLVSVATDRSVAWVLTFSLSRFMESIPVEQGIPYPSSITLLREDGRVITSTNPQLHERCFGDALGEIRLHDGKKPYFTLEKGQYIAIKQHVPLTNFSLLISAPQKINFVDIPHFLLKIMGGLGLIVLFGGGGGIWLTLRLSQPLKHFIRVMSMVGEGDLTQRYTCDALGFEFNVIGEIFNKMIQSLTYHMQEAEQERVEKEIYSKELMIGEEVQNSILPKEIPKFANLEISARFIAAKEVGGDFYDFLTNDKLMLSIADTSGKGISACLYSLSIRSMLRSYGSMHGQLDTIVHETNRLFCLDTKDSGMFVTAFIAIFDPHKRRLHYTNCGHFPPILLRRDGSIERLTTKGMAFGVAPYERVNIKYVNLHLDDLLILFTDGIIEAHNVDYQFFGEKRLLEFLNLKREQSTEQIVDTLIEEVKTFTEGAPQQDDLTAVAIRIQ